MKPDKEVEEKHYRTYSDLANDRNVKATLDYFLKEVEEKYNSERDNALKTDQEFEKANTIDFYQKKARKAQEAGRRFLAHVLGLADMGIIEEQPIDYLDKIKDDLLYLQKKDYGVQGESEHYAVDYLYGKVADEIGKREKVLTDLWALDYKYSEYIAFDGRFKPEKIVDVIKAIEVGLYSMMEEEQIEYPYGCKQKKKLIEVYDNILGDVDSFIANYTVYADELGNFSAENTDYVMLMLDTATALGLGDTELVYPVGNLGEVKRTKTMSIKNIKNKVNENKNLMLKIKQLNNLENRLQKLRD